ncbi:MAG TPA: GNAT family protein [Bacillota bacterium]|nr:GNAT family protein [Bacillota bacterium]HPO97391.1 GNAT family protein [Bacillota bacterium]
MLIKTENPDLFLRSWNEADADSLARYANNSNIWKYLRDDFPHPYNLSAALEYIKQVKEQKTYFAIVYKDEVIGDLHLRINDDIRRRSAVLGYWLAEPFWGKGLMTLLIKTITEYAFHELGLIRIYAKVFENNIGSQKVLEKAGYIKEGYFRKAIIKEDVIMDQYLYAKVSDE